MFQAGNLTYGRKIYDDRMLQGTFDDDGKLIGVGIEFNFRKFIREAKFRQGVIDDGEPVHFLKVYTR